MRASELMTTDVASVPLEATRQEIAHLLVARGISAVPVVDGSGTPLGMVSEGDLIRRGEPERQQRRDWWLAMLAEGESATDDSCNGNFPRSKGQGVGEGILRSVILDH